MGHNQNPQADLEAVEAALAERRREKARRQQAAMERMREYDRVLAKHNHEDLDQHFGSSHKSGGSKPARHRQVFSQ
jgi:hypothetical protein